MILKSHHIKNSDFLSNSAANYSESSKLYRLNIIFLKNLDLSDFFYEEFGSKLHLVHDSILSFNYVELDYQRTFNFFSPLTSTENQNN